MELKPVIRDTVEEEGAVDMWGCPYCGHTQTDHFFLCQQCGAFRVGDEAADPNASGDPVNITDRGVDFYLEPGIYRVSLDDPIEVNHPDKPFRKSPDAHIWPTGGSR